MVIRPLLLLLLSLLLLLLLLLLLFRYQLALLSRWAGKQST